MSTPLRLHPDALPARRAPGVVQFGLWPGPGCVLSGLTEDEADLLLTLRALRAEEALPDLARRHGVAPDRARDLVALLRRHGLLSPAPAGSGDGTAALRGREVCVLGRGPLPERVREELVRCGVGEVGALWREDAPAELVVLVARGAVSPQEAPLWWARRLPHLPMVAHAGRVVIGPLVSPPREPPADPSAGPCLHCLDLHRRDRDEAWPRLLAQVAPSATDLADPVGADPALCASAAAVCAMVVRDHLSGRQVSPGTTWEVSLPRGAVTMRQWASHPGCPCQSRRTA